MRVLKAKDLKYLHLAHRRFTLGNPIYKKLEALGLNDGLMLLSSEWPYDSLPQSYISGLNSTLKRKAVERHYRIHTLEAKKGWVIIRDL